jgi:hypothetical protein
VAADNPAASDISGSVQSVRDYATAARANGEAHFTQRGTEAALNVVNNRVTIPARRRGEEPTIINNSQELDDFKRATRGERSVSGYGATAPGEAYAEAYALYRRDPQYMHDHHRKAYDFFHSRHP